MTGFGLWLTWLSVANTRQAGYRGEPCAGALASTPTGIPVLVLSPPSLWRGADTTRHAVTDIYPVWSAALMSQYRVRVVWAVLVDCWTAVSVNVVCAGRAGEAAHVLGSPCRPVRRRYQSARWLQ
jgi:hypothetical protein